jgi:hypothetical protein
MLASVNALIGELWEIGFEYELVAKNGAKLQRRRFVPLVPP